MMKRPITASAAALALAWCLVGSMSASAATPAPPSNPHTRVVKGGIEVRWRLSPDDPAQVTGYEVVRGNYLGGPFVTVCKAAPGAASCVDGTAKAEHIYFYKVRSLGKTAPSPFSREASAEKSGTFVPPAR